MALEGFPLFIQPQKGADWGMEDERATTGHFQKRRSEGKDGIGMSGMPDNLI